MELDSIIPSIQSWNYTLLRCGFRLTATFGLLIGLLTVLWQITWNVYISSREYINWSFELEICFGIYGLFLASTSYYLVQIQALSWAWFHLTVSGIGILLDFALLVYHACHTKGEENQKNDHFMIAIAVCQAINNAIAVYMCTHILSNRTGASMRIRSKDAMKDDEAGATRSLLQLNQY